MIQMIKIITQLGFVDPSKIKYARFDSMGNLLVDENYNTVIFKKSMNPAKSQKLKVSRERREDRSS